MEKQGTGSFPRGPGKEHSNILILGPPISPSWTTEAEDKFMFWANKGMVSC